MTTRLKTPFGPALELRRYPPRKGDLLQAWDAADELLLEHVATLGPRGKKILILGDAFGALSAALAEFGPTAYTDSYLAARGIALNTGGRVTAVDTLARLEGPYDLVLARIPKNLSFFEDQLAAASARVRPGAPLVAGYRIKHQAKSAFGLIAKYSGETRTSLAKKKARLILSEFVRAPAASPYPLAVPIEGFASPFVNHSNVFSRERLDIGTRFFLEHLPPNLSGTVLDLGCGNGIVGIAAKRLHPGIRLVFADESRMALLSAEANYRREFPEGSADARFAWTNAYEDAEPASIDAVLCNPPFHEGTTVGDFVARAMFRDAHRALKPGGRLRIVGNSHLRYGETLRRLFGNAATVAKNSKFTIVESRKE